MMLMKPRRDERHQAISKNYTMPKSKPETVDLCVEISLQLYEALGFIGYRVPDGFNAVSWMNIPFDITS